MVDLAALGDAVPGVSYAEGSGTLRVPYNAAALVNRKLVALGLGGTPMQIRQPKSALQHIQLRPEFFPGIRERARRPGDEREVDLFTEYLFPYQGEGVLERLRAGFGLYRWPTGSGKTLAAILTLLAYPQHRGILVCLSNARLQFAREIARYTTVKAQVLSSRTAQPIDEDARIVIVGWDTLAFHAASIIHAGPYNVIFDESHRAKNRSRYIAEQRENGGVKFTLRQNIAGSALQLSRSAHARYATTATPISDRPADLWAMLDLIEPAGWGSWRSYSTRYCNGHENQFGGWEFKGTAREPVMKELAARFRVVTHDVPEEVVAKYLPKRSFLFVPLGPEDQCAPGAFAAELREASKQGEAMVSMSQRMLAAAKKRPYIIDRVAMLIEEGQRVCIFTGRKKDVELLSKALSKRVKCPVYIADGDDDLAQRDVTVAAYQKSKPAVLVGTWQSLGTSRDGLQCTQTAILGMLPDTPGELKQAAGRFHRHGQETSVVIELPYAIGTYDENVVARLADKLPALTDVIGDGSVQQLSDGFAGDAESLTKSLASKIIAASAEGKTP